MNYIMSPLQEDISVIDKLYGLLENALIDYEYQTLLESETSTSTSNDSKEIKSQINKINTKIKNAGNDKESVDQLNKLKNKYNSMLDQLIVMKDSYNNFGKGGL